jgi:hypothetical protein
MKVWIKKSEINTLEPDLSHSAYAVFYPPNNPISFQLYELSTRKTKNDNGKNIWISQCSFENISQAFPAEGKLLILNQEPKIKYYQGWIKFTKA